MQCKHFGECGSCSYYDVDYDVRLANKHEEIKTQFGELYDGKISVFRSPQSHYRARAEFQIWHIGKKSHYAMNALNRRGPVLIEECPKVIEPIEKMMQPLLDAIDAKEIDKKLFGIDFLSTLSGEMVVTLLYHLRLDEAWEAKAKEISEELGISIIGRSRKQKVVIGADFVTESLNINGSSYRFRQIENSFTQPNPRVNEQMVGWALEQYEGLGGDLLELYCGAGNFTIPFASQFKKVLATEISKSSINAAKVNMELNNVRNIDFVRMSAEEFVQALDGVRAFNRMKGIDLESYDLSTLFVDPPRAGLDEASCAFASRFEHLLYISCNPETLKRDLGVLTKTHDIEAMAMFDQFPYTHHMEMGVKLKRR
jgi:tRNA (uracil-5-)-methyltransferase